MFSCDSPDTALVDARTVVGAPTRGASPAAVPANVSGRPLTVSHDGLRTVVHRRFFELLSRLPEPAHGRILRRVFDKKYNDPDPWGVAGDSSDGAYQRRKFRTTLDCVPSGSYCRVLDAGCGEGAFTRLLPEAFTGAEVVGIDIAADAIERATALAAPQSVQYSATNFLVDPLPGTFDLVFCNEVLYYLGGSGQRRAAERLISTLTPGGLLVLVHPWPEARRLHQPFDDNPAVTKLDDYIDDDQRRPFTVALYQRLLRDDEQQADPGASFPVIPTQRN